MHKNNSFFTIIKLYFFFKSYDHLNRKYFIFFLLQKYQTYSIIFSALITFDYRCFRTNFLAEKKIDETEEEK